jgi:gamma-glutamylcyclotransferase (GGCT)/AIG2-like uncharacterized protein YtfP
MAERVREDEGYEYYPWWIDANAAKPCMDYVNDRIWMRACTTPDMTDLWQKDTHLVCVYGTLKAGFHLHDSLGQSVRLATVKTVSSDYTMLETLDPEKRFPIAFDCGGVHKYEKAQIFGELYLVPTSVLLNLDVVESNGHMFDRMLTEVEIIGQEKLKTDAWMYIGRKAFWQTYIDNSRLAPSQLFKAAKPPSLHYYFFTKNVITPKKATD